MNDMPQLESNQTPSEITLNASKVRHTGSTLIEEKTPDSSASRNPARKKSKFPFLKLLSGLGVLGALGLSARDNTVNSKDLEAELRNTNRINISNNVAMPAEVLASLQEQQQEFLKVAFSTTIEGQEYLPVFSPIFKQDLPPEVVSKLETFNLDPSVDLIEIEPGTDAEENTKIVIFSGINYFVIDLETNDVQRFLNAEAAKFAALPNRVRVSVSGGVNLREGEGTNTTAVAKTSGETVLSLAPVDWQDKGDDNEEWIPLEYTDGSIVFARRDFTQFEVLKFIPPPELPPGIDPDSPEAADFEIISSYPTAADGSTLITTGNSRDFGAMRQLIENLRSTVDESNLDGTRIERNGSVLSITVSLADCTNQGIEVVPGYFADFCIGQYKDGANKVWTLVFKMPPSSGSVQIGYQAKGTDVYVREDTRTILNALRSTGNGNLVTFELNSSVTPSANGALAKVFIDDVEAVLSGNAPWAPRLYQHDPRLARYAGQLKQMDSYVTGTYQPTGIRIL